MSQPGATNASPKPSVRCAIYTRKSTDEGLDQEFNSLDAQREAAESFIASQKHEGWTALPNRYDDGGYSGGNLERPGLRQLFSDVETGRIDCVVVYKVDRLSRSLLDFTTLMATFDEHNVSFVSVTQQFNTTTSMGRLTLNILLSFAQFEREIIGERIRDKIAAAKRKGKHTGGMPVLGYDTDRETRRLVVNPEEAELVRRLFKRFIRVGSPLLVARELNEEGRTTKRWVARNGKVCGGRPWNKHHVSRALNNRKYIGEIEHKGEIYPGEQEAIVPRKLWDDAHKIMADNYHARASRTRRRTPALLSQIIKCGHCGGAMGITFTRRREKTYRYYLCVRASKSGYDVCPVKCVAAGVVEEAVLEQIRGVFRTPELVANTFRSAKTKEAEEAERLRREKDQLADRLGVLKRIVDGLEDSDMAGAASGAAADEERRRVGDEMIEVERRLEAIETELAGLRAQAVTEREVADALKSVDPIWDELFPDEQQRVVQLLVERVVVGPEGLDVALRADGLHTLVTELRDTAEKAETRRKRG